MVADIEVIVTGNEAEALHVEQNLVKRHRPPFNIRLRDDKSFPYIAVTVEDEYPRVMFTRERHRRGVVYFGPYANAKKVRETLDVLNRVFQYRPCEGPKPGRHSGIPCLDYHIERCKAPCVGYIDREAYREIIERVIEFLSGETRPIQRELERRMQEAAAEERFEDAARYRNRLFAIRHLAERQAADRRSVGTVDVLGIATEGDRAAVQIFPLRDGRLVDRLRLPPGERRGARPLGRARGLLPGVLRVGAEHPAPARRPAGRGRHRRRSSSSSPTAGGRGSRCERPPAARNDGCRISPTRTPASRSSPTCSSPSSVACAASRRSRSCVRCSTWRACHCGSSATTSPTSSPSRRSARWSSSRTRSRRRRTTGSSACAGSTGRTTSRRWRRSSRGASPGCATRPPRSTTSRSRSMPNLVVIDGGKGQLSAALAAMQAFDLPRVAVIALAKKEEEVFVPGRAEPIVLRPRLAGAATAAADPGRGAPIRARFPPAAARDAKARGSILDEL